MNRKADSKLRLRIGWLRPHSTLPHAFPRTCETSRQLATCPYRCYGSMEKWWVSDLSLLFKTSVTDSRRRSWSIYVGEMGRESKHRRDLAVFNFGPSLILAAIWLSSILVPSILVFLTSRTIRLLFRASHRIIQTREINPGERTCDSRAKISSNLVGRLDKGQPGITGGPVDE